MKHNVPTICTRQYVSSASRPTAYRRRKARRSNSLALSTTRGLASSLHPEIRIATLLMDDADLSRSLHQQTNLHHGFDSRLTSLRVPASTHWLLLHTLAHAAEHSYVNIEGRGSQGSACYDHLFASNSASSLQRAFCSHSWSCYDVEAAMSAASFDIVQPPGTRHPPPTTNHQARLPQLSRRERQNHQYLST